MYVKKIFNQSLLYGIGSSFTSLVSFLILPVYTRLLSVQDFGKLSLILSAVFLLQYILNMGIYSGFMIRYFDFKAEDYVSHKKLSSTILFFYLAFCLVASLFIYLFLGPILRFFIGTQEKPLIIFIVLIASFEILYILPTVIMRVEERILKFCVVNFIKSFMLLVSVSFALRFTNGGINAALVAQLSVTICVTVLAYLLTYQHYGFIFDIDEFKKSVKIGLPFLIIMLSFWLIDSANKFMIKYFLSLTDVALYSIGFKIGQVILFTITVFQLVWQPSMFKIASEENAHEIFGEIFSYFLLVIFAIAIIVSLFSRELILMFSTKSYISSFSLVPIIVFAYALYGIFYYLQTPLIIKKRTFLLMIICVGGTLFNIIANFIAIPLFGIIGAAYATAITYFVMAYTVFLLSQRVLRVSYDLSKFSKISFAVLLVLILAYLGDAYHLSGILSKITLIILFFAILLIVDFFGGKDTLRDIKNRFSQICDKASRKCNDLETFPGYFMFKKLEALLILDKSGFSGKSPILEIGCGTGFQSTLLSNCCSKIIATDLPNFSKATHTIGITNARQMSSRLGIANIDYISCSAERLPFKERSFSCVFASSVLEHIEDKSAVLTEIRRVLKDDGIVVCIVPTYMESLFQFPSLYIYMIKRGLDIIRSKLFKVKINYNSIFFEEGNNDFVRDSGEFFNAFFHNNPSFPLPEPHGDWRNKKGKQSILVEFFQQLPWSWNRMFSKSGLKIKKTFSVLFIPYRILEILSPKLVTQVYYGTQFLHRKLAESFLRYFSISICYVARKEN